MGPVARSAGRSLAAGTGAAESGDLLSAGAGELTARPFLLALAGLERFGRRAAEGVCRSTGAHRATGRRAAGARDRVPVELEVAGRPGLAPGAGVDRLLGGRRRRGLLGQRERGDEEREDDSKGVCRSVHAGRFCACGAKPGWAPCCGTCAGPESAEPAGRRRGGPGPGPRPSASLFRGEGRPRVGRRSDASHAAVRCPAVGKLRGWERGRR